MIQVEYTDYTFDQYLNLKEAEKGILQQFSDSNGDSLPLDIKEFADIEGHIPAIEGGEVQPIDDTCEEPIAIYSCKWLVELQKIDDE